MIVDSFIKNNRRLPKIPENIKPYVKGVSYLKDTNQFKVELNEPKISSMQGKILLNRMGLLEQVEQAVLSDIEGKIVWENSTVWNRFSPMLEQISQGFDVDLDEFFEQAKQIDV